MGKHIFWLVLVYHKHLFLFYDTFFFVVEGVCLQINSLCLLCNENYSLLNAGPHAFIDLLGERMFKPSLSTILSENTKYVSLFLMVY